MTRTAGKADIPPLVIGGVSVEAGESRSIDLPVSRLHTHTEMTMPVRVVRGREPGPALFVCAAVHGDEICGVEIIRRLLSHRALKTIAGTLIAVPVVNVFGFIGHSRYLPDRRDLNRMFPGSEKGSLAARLAHLFMSEVVANATHGIDIHTGALHRQNLPHVRVRSQTAETFKLAEVFGVPLVLQSDLRDGSLREAVANTGKPVLMFEAGEALRFDEWAVRAGLRGVLNVMAHLQMVQPTRSTTKRLGPPVYAESSTWVRASESGILRTEVALGAAVRQGTRLGTVGDPFGDREVAVLAPVDGIVVGRSNIPLVYEGDALFHIARVEPTADVEQTLALFQSAIGSGEHFDPEEGPLSEM
jgi:predicted deacylase